MAQAMTDAGADTRELLRRWHEQADGPAREQLVDRMLPLTRMLARRYANRGEPLDDLFQVAAVGLLKAIDRFDIHREVRFTTFAVPTIAGEIKRHFRDRGWMVRVPRDLQELAGQLAHRRDELTTTLGRPPTIAELAAEGRASPELVVEALAASDAYRALSLDEPIGEGRRGDAFGLDDAGFERTEQRLLLGGALRDLPVREREILHMRFFEGLTQREIAARVGISQMHVSRLIRRSIDALRESIERPPALAVA